MEHSHHRLPWEATGWIDEVAAWIERQVARNNVQMTGPVEVVHQRPWSAFLQIETDQGRVYFKATAPGSEYEAPLTEALACWRPDCTVPLLAVDPSKGWLLSVHTGVTFRGHLTPQEQLEHWEKLLPVYSEFQIEMAERVPALLDLGVPDRQLPTFAAKFVDFLDNSPNLFVDQPDGLTRDEHEQLLALRPYVAAQCQSLGAFGLPATLTHEEIHENNVLLGEEGYIFTDWSDCSVSHPFFSWLVTRRSVAHWLKLDETGTELTRLRDAYVEPWTHLASRSQLLEALDLAFRLGMLNRALSWDEAMGHLAPEHKAPYADSVSGWLQDYLVAERAARRRTTHGKSDRDQPRDAGGG